MPIFLTSPSDPSKNNPCDNINHDLIVYTGQILYKSDVSKYQVVSKLGSGTFGQVFRCIKNGKTYAVKIIKNETAYFNHGFSEVKVLKKLTRNNNFTYLFSEFIEDFMFNNHLCIVIELLGKNLYEVLKMGGFKGLEHSVLKRVIKQILNGLDVLNKLGIMHCDLKPENILVSDPENIKIKIIDFGNALDNRKSGSFYVQSRYYRAPEVILGLSYDFSIDMWSFGCIIYELYMGIPLFPGKNNADMINRIVYLLGYPPNFMIEYGLESEKYFSKKLVEKKIIPQQRKNHEYNNNYTSKMYVNTKKNLSEKYKNFDTQETNQNPFMMNSNHGIGYNNNNTYQSSKIIENYDEQKEKAKFYNYTGSNDNFRANFDINYRKNKQKTDNFSNLNSEETYSNPYNDKNQINFAKNKNINSSDCFDLTTKIECNEFNDEKTIYPHKNDFNTNLNLGNYDYTTQYNDDSNFLHLDYNPELNFSLSKENRPEKYNNHDDTDHFTKTRKISSYSEEKIIKKNNENIYTEQPQQETFILNPYPILENYISMKKFKQNIFSNSEDYIETKKLYDLLENILTINHLKRPLPFQIKTHPYFNEEVRKDIHFTVVDESDIMLERDQPNPPPKESYTRRYSIHNPPVSKSNDEKSTRKRNQSLHEIKYRKNSNPFDGNKNNQ